MHPSPGQITPTDQGGEPPLCPATSQPASGWVRNVNTSSAALRRWVAAGGSFDLEAVGEQTKALAGLVGVAVGPGVDQDLFEVAVGLVSVDGCGASVSERPVRAAQVPQAARRGTGESLSARGSSSSPSTTIRPGRIPSSWSNRISHRSSSVAASSSTPHVVRPASLRRVTMAMARCSATPPLAGPARSPVPSSSNTGTPVTPRRSRCGPQRSGHGGSCSDTSTPPTSAINRAAFT